VKPAHHIAPVPRRHLYSTNTRWLQAPRSPTRTLRVARGHLEAPRARQSKHCPNVFLCCGALWESRNLIYCSLKANAASSAPCCVWTEIDCAWVVSLWFIGGCDRSPGKGLNVS
jgi:hypothetical protein